ncbi:hypothetical protein CC2G_005003 [Coprinopsis cinerea AmutBmut pab1-1]|nr:hypothetical protein CC2G_005003 [Coprinopsis cinerea AmutBmut pab1-1]
MKFTTSLFAALAVASTFVGSALSASTVPGCYAECLEKAATAIGCAADDIECIKASSQFTTIVGECVATSGCTALAPGSAADADSITATFNLLSGLGLVDAADADFSAADILEERDLTGLSRVLPVEKRQSCPTRRGLCFTSGLAACRAHCRGCHLGSNGRDCVRCPNGAQCTGVIGQTCTCLNPCPVC